MAVDFHAPHVEDAQKHVSPVAPNIDFVVHDMVQAPMETPFRGAYTLDVFEHLLPEQSHVFLSNVADSLTDHGVLVLGTPSLESQVYASEETKKGAYQLQIRQGPSGSLSKSLPKCFSVWNE